MIPGLDLKMVRPDLTGPQMTEEDDSTEANIYLGVCEIMFFIDFYFFLLFQVIMLVYISAVALIIVTTVRGGWWPPGKR